MAMNTSDMIQRLKQYQTLPWPKNSMPVPTNGAVGPGSVGAYFDELSLAKQQPPSVKMVEATVPLDSPIDLLLARLRPYAALLNGWIMAGGVFRRQEEGFGHFDGDVDFFMLPGADSGNFRAAMHELNAKPAESPAGTYAWDMPVPENTFGVPTIRIQIVTHRAYTDVASLLRSFDFSINQAGCLATSLGEYIHSEDFKPDVVDRVLRMAAPRSLQAFMRRYTKFVRQGYYMPDKEMMKVFERMGNGDMTITANEYDL